MIERTRAEGCAEFCGTGIMIVDNVDAVVRDSVLSDYAAGLLARANFTDRKAEVLVKNRLVTGNGSGIHTDGDGGGIAVVDVEGTTVAFNGAGLFSTGDSFINSRKDNTLRRNVTDGAFSTTFTPQ